MSFPFDFILSFFKQPKVSDLVLSGVKALIPQFSPYVEIAETLVSTVQNSAPIWNNENASRGSFAGGLKDQIELT